MIRNWCKFFILSHLFLTISVFVFSNGFLHGSNQSLAFSLALAFAVFGVYNLNRLNKLEKSQLPSQSHSWYEQNFVILRFTAIFCLIISALIYVYLLGKQPLSLILLGATGLLVILYIYTVKKVNLRQIPGTKAFWISLVWTLMMVVIPKMTMNIFILSDLHYCILFVALSIPGDIRDRDIDNPKMKTIPQLIGNRKATMLIYSLISLFIFVNYVMSCLSIKGIIMVSLFLIVLSIKQFPFRHELMDGTLMALGVFYLIG
jgi:hypothetical protein